VPWRVKQPRCRTPGARGNAARLGRVVREGRAKPSSGTEVRDGGAGLGEGAGGSSSSCGFPVDSRMIGRGLPEHRRALIYDVCGYALAVIGLTSPAYLRGRSK
jgi:hypothetical protein